MSTTTITQENPKDVKVIMSQLVNYFTNEKNNIPQTIAKTFLKTYGKPSDNWSFGNKMIMLAVGNTSDARTYNQWFAVNRQVQKGQKGFYIIAPNFITVEKINKQGEKEKIKILHGFITCPHAMFALHQTKGKEIKYVEKPKQLPPLYEVAEKMGLKVKYDSSVIGEYGSYDPTTDELRLCTDDIGTFFHELAHAVQKKIEGGLKGGQQKEQEIIAEFTSCVLASIYGYDKKSYTYNYIKYYSDDKEKVGEEILKIMGKVEKILNYIFEVKKN